jgi:hypothetical protein
MDERRNEILELAYWRWIGDNQHALDLGGVGDLQSLLDLLTAASNGTLCEIGNAKSLSEGNKLGTVSNSDLKLGSSILKRL